MFFCFWQPEPIYMLIPLNMPDANARISNLKLAVADYVAEYNVCKCKPCQNGGTLTLLDGKCMCLCPHLFEGMACQNYKGDKAKRPGTCEQMKRHIRYPSSDDQFSSKCSFKQCFAVKRPTVNQEGNWSCWSSWASCSGGKRSRTRGCNTEGLSGAQCRGDSTGEEYC